MATAKKAKRKTSAASTQAKVSWGETMKKALASKRQGGKGPQQPKPRDSGTFKVKKDAF